MVFLIKKRVLAFTEIKVYTFTVCAFEKISYVLSYHLPWDKTHLIKVRNTWQPHLSSELSKSLKSPKRRHTRWFNKEQQFHESFCLKRFTRKKKKKHWKCWNSKDRTGNTLSWQCLTILHFGELHSYVFVRFAFAPHWWLGLPVAYFFLKIVCFHMNNIITFHLKSPIIFDLLTWGLIRINSVLIHTFSTHWWLGLPVDLMLFF